MTALTLSLWRVAGFVQVIADEGLPVYHESEHGNLYVEYSVVLPTKLSAKTKAGTCDALGLQDTSVPSSWTAD